MRRLAPWLFPFLALALVAAALSPAALRADEGLERGGLVDARTKEAIDAGLRFLARTQSEDGSWSSNAGKKINESYRPFDGGEDIPHVGITSLGILAFLAGGHLPDRGPYGETLHRAVDFVTKQVTSSGFISANHTRMYSHAFATLALAEVYGVTRAESVRKPLEYAAEFTVRCQNETGGWRYVPFTKDSDMSVTVCQVVALRAARNVGIKVPRSTIDRALRYVIESANTGQNQYEVGSFLYQPQTQQFNRDSFSLCAAGLTTLFQAGLYDDQSIAAYIHAHRIEKSEMRIDDFVSYMQQMYLRVARQPHYFFYYGGYYATQAMYQIGLRRPDVWSSWYRQIRDDLLAVVRWGPSPTSDAREAWWTSNVDTTNAYATASALLILQFPLDQLPIHRR